MSGSRVLHRWDDKSDRDLLIAVLDELAPTPDQIRKAVERCRASGYSFTVGAATQHLQKLKRKDSNGPGAPATPSTPKSTKKAGGAAGSAAKSTGKRGRKTDTLPPGFDDEEEFNDPEATPSKKAKREATGTKMENDAALDVVKSEHVDDVEAI